MTFDPIPRSDRWYALAVIAALIALDVQVVRLLVQRPVDGVSFLLGLAILFSLLLAAYLGYRTFAAFTLAYWVDRDAVTLVWGVTRQIVPMGQITRVLRGVSARPANAPRPWHWPYPHRRRLVCPGLGIVNAYATRPLAEQTILVTAEESYGLTPADPEAFLVALQERYALGVARIRECTLIRPPLWTWSLWRDRTALSLIGAGLLGVLLMFGVLCFRFPYLSADLPLHFDAAGLPDRIAPKSGLFILPIIGVITWGVNLVLGVWMYRRLHRPGAYLLWGGTLAVLGIAGLALFNLMRW